MDFLFSGVFWGVILILLGASVIINMVFHVHIPLMRIIFACILVYLGIRVLIGGHWSPRWGRPSTVVFAEANVSASASGEYNIVFGKGTIDTTQVITGEGGRSSIKVNTVFGASVVKIPKSIPVVMRISSAFAGVQLPDGSTTAFGEYTYRNEAARTMPDSVERRYIELNCVFGGCQVQEQ